MTSTTAQANRGGFDTLDYKRFDQWKDDCLSATRDPKELEAEAASFFSSQPVHRERALALLIQSLEPAFAATRLKTRHYALVCLQGALATPMTTVSLSVMKLVGDFLLQHGGPILVETEEPDGEWDMDEQVRDSATKAVANLLAAQMPRANLDDDEMVADTIRYRVQLSQEAIRRRCALPDREGEVDNQQFLGSSAPRGLASLPRSRRTMCFDVLQSTLDGIQTILESVWAPSPQHRNKRAIVDNLSMSILTWSELAINCLHGESDPRCLLQLLRLLSGLQNAFVHVLEKNFPVDAMFDAVSAYYPVQFSPPKNMSVPVTKQDLTDALWKTLSCTVYDEHLAKAGKDTMFSLTLGVILEQLMPLPEDEPPTLTEQKEALMDLKQLLGVSNTEESVDAVEKDRVGPATLSTISSVLRSIHAKTAVQGTSDASTISQQLSHLCRGLIAAIARACESRSKPYWNAFVKEPVHDLIHGHSTTSWSRSDIVYLSCLAGCGGIKSLQLVLDQTLPAFLSMVADKDASAEEDDFLAAKTATQMSLSLFGIAALCAAIQTSVDKQHVGLTLNPHPLQKHDVVSAILLAWNQTRDISSVSQNCRKSFVALRLAAVRAMEATLLVLPEIPDSNQMKEVVSFIQDLSHRVTYGKGDGPEDEKLFKSACARLLGITVGEAMKGTDPKTGPTCHYLISRTGPLKQELTETIFPRLLDHVSSPHAQLSLAVLCTQSKAAATTTTEKLMTGVVERIQNQPDSREAIDDMASILTRGGRNATEAFQNSDFLIKLRSVLLPQRSSNVDISSRVSALQLPSTAEEIESEETDTWKMIGLLEPLLPLYSSSVSARHLNNLLMATCKVVPPLDSNDRKRFAVLLPFLASALQGADSVTILEQLFVDEITAYLPGFILSNASSTARSYAASCLNSFLARNKNKECLCLALVADSVLPAIIQHVDDLQRLLSKKPSSVEKLSVVLSNIAQALIFLGSIASAAIQRGGSSASTADKIVAFVTGLACNGRAYSIGISATTLIDLNGLDGVDEIIKASAVSAFGSVVSVDSIGSLSKQRLCYTAWKAVQNCHEQGTQLSVGVMGVASFIVCCANWKGISATMSTALTDVVLLGLSCERSIPASTKKVLLAALIRLMHLNPLVVEKNVVYVVSGVLRAYATTSEVDGPQLMPCKLLALQALQTLSTALTPRAVHAVKPAVVSILEQAMFDKSSILRHAAVTCNHYFSGSSNN